MGFEIDYKKVDLETFTKKLEKKYLVPSRKILHEDTVNRLNVLIAQGLESVDDLRKILKNKKEFDRLSDVKPLNRDFLTMLLRELNSIQTKSEKLGNFDFINSDYINRLEMLGLGNTKKLYPRILTAESREALSKESDIPLEDINYISQLCDLTRVQWVNSTFSRVLHRVGVDTLLKFKEADPEELYKKINELNKRENIYKGNIGLNDISICVEASKEVEVETDF